MANVRSLGVRPDGAPRDPPGYQPQRVVRISRPAGMVIAGTEPITPSSILVYDPNNPAADSEGLAALPNVFLEQEFVIQLQVKTAYEADLATLDTRDEVPGSLLDVAS